MTLATNRDSQRAVNRPSVSVNSVFEHAPAKSSSSPPLGHGERYTVVCYQSVVAFITTLIEMCSPIAVIRRVVAAVVSAFNGVLWRWAFSHVANKVRNRFKPSVTHNNSTSTIVFERSGIVVIASRLNVAVNAPFDGMGQPVLSIVEWTRISSKASTGACDPVNQTCFANYGLSATRADAKIFNGLVFNGSDSGKPAEVFSSYIYRIGIKFDKLQLSHFVTSNNRLIRGGLFPQPVLHYNTGGALSL